MAHVLRQDELQEKRWVTAPRACVTVEVVFQDRRPRLVVTGGPIGVLRDGYSLAPVPARIPVVDPEGRILRPSRGRRFWMSLETFDPFHVVTELPE